MSTLTEDVTTAAPQLLVCGACGTSVPKPAPAQWASLWDSGWRWLGTLGLFSCPACPPVVTVDEQGRHVRP